MMLASLLLGACNESGTPPVSDMADNLRGRMNQSVEGIILPGEKGGTLYHCETAEPIVFTDTRELLKKSVEDSLIYGATLVGKLNLIVSNDGNTFRLKEVEHVSAQWFRSGCLMIQHIQALGNEPGWELRLDPPHELVFRSNYGAEEVTFPYVLPATTDGKWTYDVKIGEGESAEQLFVTIIETACMDSMAGDDFQHTVEVIHNGVTYHGCGRLLSDAPQIQ